MERVLVFANPIAGRGRGAGIARSVAEGLRASGYAVSVYFDSAHHVAPQEGPIRAAVVIGGDGTLRRVAQWAIDCAGPGEGPSCVPYPLLVVPMGTANLMGQHLGVRWTEGRLPQQVLEALAGGRTVLLDVARTGEGIFLLMAGVGFDAAVVHELDRARRGPITQASYVWPILRAAREYRFPALDVTVDGRMVARRMRGLALVGNVREYGTGFAAFPRARADDEMLDVCILPCASLPQLIRLMLLAPSGQHIGEEGVIYMKGRHIRVESDGPVPVQVDGEPAGFTPVSMDLLPGRIAFIVPGA